VLVADAQRVKGLAPLACKTEKVDARVLAELSFRVFAGNLTVTDPAHQTELDRARERRERRDEVEVEIRPARCL